MDIPYGHPIQQVGAFPTTEKMEVPYSKSLGLDETLLDKSFIQIKNKIGPNIKPWGTPAFTRVYLDVRSFRITFDWKNNRSLL